MKQPKEVLALVGKFEEKKIAGHVEGLRIQASGEVNLIVTAKDLDPIVIPLSSETINRLRHMLKYAQDFSKNVGPRN